MMKQHFYIQIGTGLEPSYLDFTRNYLHIKNIDLHFQSWIIHFFEMH
jgi:hypothetical protein